MAIVGGFCQDCNSPVEFHVGQAVSSGKLVWDFFYICYNCGCEIGGHDTGVPPEEIRKAILDAEGEWSLAVLETGKLFRI